MTKIIWPMSVSLDGYAAGAHVNPENSMGDGGTRLHEWLFKSEHPVDAQVAQDMRAAAGAVVLGKRTFEVGVHHWGGTPYPAPSFVLCHQPPPPVDGFTFVTEGLEEAVRQARAATGDGDVLVMGAETGQQVLAAGLLDEIWLQLVPVLLGSGTPLFGTGPAVEMTPVSVEQSPYATHLRYRVA